MVLPMSHIASCDRGIGLNVPVTRQRPARGHHREEKMKAFLLRGAALGAMSAGLLATAGWAETVTPDRLLNAASEAEAGNWLMVHRTYDSHRFSPLDEIDSD